MGYVEDLLASGEVVIYRTRKHWVAPILATVTGALLTLGGLVALIWGTARDEGEFLNAGLQWGGWVALLAGLMLLARAFAVWWQTEYVVTNQKVLKVSGMVRRAATGSALEKINDTLIEQPLLGRILDYGTVQVLTAADEANLRYRIMAHPLRFRRAILDAKLDWDAQQAAAIGDAVRQGQAQMPAAPRDDPEQRASTGPEITALIGQLAGLRDAGAITVEEFEAKKAELLSRL